MQFFFFQDTIFRIFAQKLEAILSSICAAGKKFLKFNTFLPIFNDFVGGAYKKAKIWANFPKYATEGI